MNIVFSNRYYKVFCFVALIFFAQCSDKTKSSGQQGSMPNEVLAKDSLINSFCIKEGELFSSQGNLNSAFYDQEFIIKSLYGKAKDVENTNLCVQSGLLNRAC
ncbi:hypothetical protein RCC89_14670 [Cytophagaceae bacterium ABcell3]|nr:hypothetical protein RCC89_14670 [Cytophagaceae bacterium ABcell3]